MMKKNLRYNEQNVYEGDDFIRPFFGSQQDQTFLYSAPIRFNCFHKFQALYLES